MKYTKHVTLTLCFLSLIHLHQARAIENVPPLIAAPMVLLDEANNTLEDGDYHVIVRLANSIGSVLYQEEHLVRVFKGVAHLSLGGGYAVGSDDAASAGGLSYDLFLEDGDISVEVLVEGQLTPQILTILGSQPYAFVSDYAMNVPMGSVTSSHIANSTIKPEDLDPQFLQELLSSNNDTTSESFSGTITSTNVLVSSQLGLNNATGSSLNEVLRGLDRSIDTVRDVHLDQKFNLLDQANSSLENTVNQHISNRSNPHQVTIQQIGAAPTIHGHDEYLRHDGARSMSYHLNMGGYGITNVGTVDGIDIDKRITSIESDINTLQQQGSGAPRILAMANVDANTSTIRQAIYGTSYNINRVEWVPQGSCGYIVYFQKPAQNSYSYVVTSNLLEGDNGIIIRDQTADSFRVQPMDDDGYCVTGEDFNILVVGY